MGSQKGSGALGAVPDEARTSLSEAYRLAEDGQLGAAAQQCKRALALVPNWTQANQLYGTLLNEMGLRDRAATVLAQAAGPNRVSFDVRARDVNVTRARRLRIGQLLDEASAALQEGHTGSAWRLSERAFVLDPDCGEVHYFRAHVLEVLGRDKEATEAYSRARALDPRPADIRYVQSEGGAVPVDEASAQDLVTIRAYSFASEAEVARGRLEADGIPAMLTQGEIVATNWLFSNMVHGVKLCVRAEDVERALAALEPEANAPHPEVCCPVCGSGNVRYEKYHLRWIYAIILLLKIPLPIRRDRWTCASCGLSWKEGKWRA